MESVQASRESLHAPCLRVRDPGYVLVRLASVTTRSINTAWVIRRAWSSSTGSVFRFKESVPTHALGLLGRPSNGTSSSSVFGCISIYRSCCLFPRFEGATGGAARAATTAANPGCARRPVGDPPSLYG